MARVREGNSTIVNFSFMGATGIADGVEVEFLIESRDGSAEAGK